MELFRDKSTSLQQKTLCLSWIRARFGIVRTLSENDSYLSHTTQHVTIGRNGSLLKHECYVPRGYNQLGARRPSYSQ